MLIQINHERRGMGTSRVSTFNLPYRPTIMAKWQTYNLGPSSHEGKRMNCKTDDSM